MFGHESIGRCRETGVEQLPKKLSRFGSSGVLSVEMERLTRRVIGCAFVVSNTLGAGFFEKVYENALVHELSKNLLPVCQQQVFKVYYDGVMVGEYYADLVVDNRVLVELKAVHQLEKVNLAQCFNYLRASGLGVCLLMNFGQPKLEYRRILNPNLYPRLEEEKKINSDESDEEKKDME
jgi:GxxExxY protein